MMISYSHIFKKMFKKLSARHQDQCGERLTIFAENPHHPLLHNHSLSGQWIGCRSINIGGDLRAVYEETAKNQIEFIVIGSHSELYS